MKTEALSRIAGNSTPDVQRTMRNDVTGKKPRTEWVSYGFKADFSGLFLTTGGKNEGVSPYAFGSSGDWRDVRANAAYPGDHPQASELCSKYLGETIPSELAKINTVSTISPSEINNAFRSNQPFKIEVDLIDHQDRYTLESIMRGIKSDESGKIHYSIYELPQGSPAYSEVYKNITALSQQKQILDNNGQGKWKIEKVILQVKEADRRKLKPTNNYADALPYEIDNYKIISLFSPHNES